MKDQNGYHRSNAGVQPRKQDRGWEPLGFQKQTTQLRGHVTGEAVLDHLERGAKPKANDTGLPDKLKGGVEALSGLSMDDVKVHRDSPSPGAMGALAYAKGSDIHLGPGQEQHLPHEAWHVVQQKQGRVAPTTQMKGAPVNDDAALEREADVMGARALNHGSAQNQSAQATQRKADGPVQHKLKEPSTLQLKDPRNDYTHLDVYGYGGEMDNDGNFKGENAKDHKKISEKNRSGLFKSKPKEVKIRIMMLTEKILEAYKIMQSKKDEADGEVLGVFTAPEWFFKNPGKPFSSSDKASIEAAFKGVSSTCEGMMIIPGSILWTEGKSSKMRTRSTAMVFMNGKKIKEHHKHDNAGDTDGYNQKHKKAYNKTAKEDTSDTKFNVGNLSMSIEICGDHSSKRSRKEEDSGKTSSGEVDVQIIISHGMDYQKTSNTAREGGLVITNDSNIATHTKGDKKGEVNEDQLSPRSIYTSKATKPTSALVGKTDQSKLRVGDKHHKLPTPTSRKEANTQCQAMLDLTAPKVIRRIRAWGSKKGDESFVKTLKTLSSGFEKDFADLLDTNHDAFAMIMDSFLDKVKTKLQKYHPLEDLTLFKMLELFELENLVNTYKNTTQHIQNQAKLYQKSQ